MTNKGVKYSPQQKAALSVQVAEQYLQGRPQYVIAEALSIHEATVGALLAQLRSEWQRQAGLDFTLRVALELARIDLLERNYWQAWERSKGDQVVMKTRFKNNQVDLNSFQERVTRKDMPGDPRYLDGIAKCIEMRLKIVGGFAPTKLDVDWRQSAVEHGVDPEALVEQFLAHMNKNGPGS